MRPESTEVDLSGSTIRTISMSKLEDHLRSLDPIIDKMDDKAVSFLLAGAEREIAKNM